MSIHTCQIAASVKTSQPANIDFVVIAVYPESAVVQIAALANGDSVIHPLDEDIAV